MPNFRNLLVLLSAAFALLCSFTAAASNPFTGQFLVDNRPRELIYVSITQAENIVSGLMILVSAADKGKTEKTTLALEGIADKTTVTLREKRFLGDYVLTGRRKGNNLILAFPGRDGSVIPTTFVPATESEYSNKLTEWQKLHADIYKEQSTILNHASALAEQIHNIENTGIPKLLLETSKLLSDQKAIAASFQKRREHFQKVAAVNGSFRCDYVYSQVSPFFYSDMSGYFYSDFSPMDMRYQQALSDISKRIDNAPEVIAKAKNDASLLKEALSKRRFPIPKLPKLPDDEQSIFDGYITLAKNSASEIESIRAQYTSIANTVEKIMRESEHELNIMESKCR
ncbi:MAG: hypothetical protein KF908_10275 [Nitrosomonas sp.]|nr:hypothetical protein [Nitrosomonas sp.]MCW5608272.1 hypothetical protein [Nitrosomonas sp.]